MSNKSLEQLKSYHLVPHTVWNIEDKSNVLKLDWNESVLPPSPKVFNALTEYIARGQLNWYPDTCNQGLINALGRYLQISPEYIQYFAGSDALQEYVCQAFLNVGDKVLSISPTYDNFRIPVQSNGAILEYFDLNDNFSIDIDNFIVTINEQEPKLVYIPNPNNPTGSVLSTDAIELFLKECKNSIFIIDEAYIEFALEYNVVNLVSRYSNLLICRTFSKAFALASFRVGYLVTDPNNIKLIDKIRNAKNIAMLSQVAAIAALSDVDYTQRYVAEIKKSRQYLLNELGKVEEVLQVYQSMGNFILIKVRDAKKLPTMIAKLAEHLIFVRSLSHLRKMDGFFRITIPMMKDVRFVATMIVDCLKNM